MERDPAAIEQAYHDMMEIAREEMDPSWECGQVVVVETWPGEYHWAKAPDAMDPAIREPNEDALIAQLVDWNETRVLSCLCVWKSGYPTIPSWNMRSRLVELNPDNLQTMTFLWGGGEDILVKPFSALLPPKKEQTQ